MTNNTNFFSLLQAYPLPILDQQALTHITISTDNKGGKVRFTLWLVSKLPSPMCQFVITTVWGKWASWEEHLEWLIRGAIKCIWFLSSVCLYLLHCVNHAQELYSPLLCLLQISILCTSGWFTLATFKLLMDPSDPTHPPPLPHLKCFCFRGDNLYTPVEEIQSSVKLCIQSRFDRRQLLAICHWVHCGNETCLIIPPLELLTDSVAQVIPLNG